MTEYCYIHIPFCKSKCKYCSFVSFACTDKMTGYSYSLMKEISENYRGEKLKTLYIGGGTPSLLPLNLLGKIINKFNFGDVYEFTIEVNPDDITQDTVKIYRDFGINRVSVGVQSFEDDILKEIGRRHNSQAAISAVDTLYNNGFSNISIDLIYGLPGQTSEGFLKDLRLAVSLPVSHISLYGLKIEENSYYYTHLPTDVPDDDIQADMYLAACNFLEQSGFEQYEISNFSRNGAFSRHNMNYWYNNTYYGFGVSAHGYVEGFRYYNTSDIDEYIANPVCSEYAHHVTEKERLEEEIFLGLRKTEGINIFDINKKFNIDFECKYKNVIEKYSPEFMCKKSGYLSLTRKGFMLSNIILSEFI